jgi:glycosyltransferase involved in cell wall biosynthesis
LKSIISNFFISDFHIVWAYKAYKKAVKIHDIDVVYATFPIASAHLLGMLLAKKFKKPLILDYRDLWFGNNIFKKSISFVNRFNKVIEKHIIKKSSYVIFTTKFAKNKYLEYKMIQSAKEHCVLWNGFDPDDYQSLSNNNCNPAEKNNINIVYTGGLGNINSTRRTPKYLFNAISKIKNEFSFDIYGEIPLDVIHYASNIKGINFHGLISHNEIAQKLNNADILVVVLTPDEDLTAVPGKIYEYMYSHKYILALTDKNSQLASLLYDYNFASIVDPFDEEVIYQELTKIIENKYYSSMEMIDKYMINQFNRKDNSEKLYKIIKKLVEKQ